MPTINKIDKKLAKELANEMFKFEHLFVLDANMTGVLLREIENDTLVLALKGLEEEQREQFYGAMLVNGTLIARGEVVAQAGRFAIRVLEIVGGSSPSEAPVASAPEALEVATAEAGDAG